MVLESIINPRDFLKSPWKIFLIGLAYGSFGILLSLITFHGYESLVFVFLTVLSCTHFVYLSIRDDELASYSHKIPFFREHGPILALFIFLFLGFLISYSAWYLMMPAELTSRVFAVQHDTINMINHGVSGKAIDNVGSLALIFTNNIKVMLFCILFSFLFGIGALFILTWNASVIAAAIGNFTRASMESGPIAAFSLGLLRYLIHGIPEILAYFMAGLAGGIIAIAVIRHDFGSKGFYNVLKDSTKLTALAVSVLIVAAVIEVYVTPILFA